MTVRLSFDGSDERVQAALKEKGEKIVEALVPKLNALMIELQAHIVRDKLSGQVLHHRSGKLAASIRTVPAHEEGGELVAAVEGAGGPAFYGKFHEFGTDRAYPIRPVHAKALAFFGEGGVTKTNAIRIMAGLRKGSAKAQKQFSEAGGVVVKSVMHPPIQKRSFMATAQEDMKGQIEQEIIERIDEVLNAAD